MCQEEILRLIGRISPHARDYVSKAFENNTVEVLHSIMEEEQKGVFIKVDNEDFCVFYASYDEECDMGHILQLIDSETRTYISKMNSKEVCFNVYGNNEKIINLVRTLGFKSDMEGYHLEYGGKELLILGDCGLVDKPYEENFIKEFVELFDGAYYELNKENGWRVDGHAAQEKHFNERLKELNELNQVRCFYLERELVGAYIFEQNYIADIVVKQVHQNKGYGSYMLVHCIRSMMESKGVEKVRLRVAKTNTQAKRLYERNGFIEIACFAEHTFNQAGT